MPKEIAVIELAANPKKKEHSIAYRSTSWPDLTALIDDPKGVIDGLSTEFSMSPGSNGVKLEIALPAVIFIEPYELNRTTARLFDLEEDYVEATKGKRGLGIRADFFAKMLPQGGFIAEFASQTRTIYVRYIPPQIKAPMFNPAGKITPQTMIMWETERGNMHFDIGNDLSDVARFVTDYLVDRADLVDRCMKSKLDYSEDVAGSRFKAPKSASVISGAKTSRRTFGGDKKQSPIMIIEQVDVKTRNGGTTPGCVCVDADIVKSGSGYNVEAAIIKIYAQPCP
ncbi:MAG: hypothetical protein BGO01_09075 [Armatimonadetes bacterium 55-13]|jgi:hypothetical protein|nr:hypothetical protein [Armatimonadota bacterium]OJU62014.1 MAG: hypothetical protein BGO01_09075 [Armatimonadetes bacterium 55-13]